MFRPSAPGNSARAEKHETGQFVTEAPGDGSRAAFAFLRPAPSTGANPLARLVKMKNADAPAVKREAEEDWGRWR
jgi:hypothetical protein